MSKEVELNNFMDEEFDWENEFLGGDRRRQIRRLRRLIRRLIRRLRRLIRNGGNPGEIRRLRRLIRRLLRLLRRLEND